MQLTAITGSASQMDLRSRSTVPAEGIESAAAGTPPKRGDQSDRVELSGSTSQATGRSPSGPEAANAEGQSAAQAQRRATTAQELSARDKRVLEELKAEDTAVREHERAHLAAAGQYVRGGANYQYEIGPDGNRYAVHGEVQIEASEVPNNPSGTIQKMQIVRRAALAPRDPSPQDQRVAAQASRAEMEARAELARERVARTQLQAGTAVNGPTGTPTESPLIDQFA